MSDETAREERERAHTWELFLMLLRDGCVADAMTMERTFGTIRDCIPIPRAELEQLRAESEIGRRATETWRANHDALIAENERGRRALFELMEEYGYPGPPHTLLLFDEIGFLEYDWNDDAESTLPSWTEKARAFAASMSGEKERTK